MAEGVSPGRSFRKSLLVALAFCCVAPLIAVSCSGQAADWRKCPPPKQETVHEEAPAKTVAGPTALYIDGSGSMDGFVQKADSPYPRVIANFHRVLPLDTVVFKFGREERRLDGGPAAIPGAAQAAFYHDASINDRSNITRVVDAAARADEAALTLIISDLFLRGEEILPRTGPMRSSLMQALEQGRTIGILGVLNPVVLRRGFDPQDLGLERREQLPPGLVPVRPTRGVQEYRPNLYLPFYVVAIGPELRVRETLRRIRSVADLDAGEATREAYFSGRQARIVPQSADVAVQSRDPRVFMSLAAGDVTAYQIDAERLFRRDGAEAPVVTLKLDRSLDPRVAGATGLEPEVSIRKLDEKACRGQKGEAWQQLSSKELKAAFHGAVAADKAVTLSVKPDFFAPGIFRSGDAVLIDITVKTIMQGRTTIGDAWMRNIPNGWGFDDTSWEQIRKKFILQQPYGPSEYFPTRHLQELRDSLNQVLDGMPLGDAQTVAYGRMLLIID